MQILRDIPALRDTRAAWYQARETVALVPTMGNLHEGHLALVRQARGRADRLVVSLFVNPLQFDRPEDLAAYPRSLEADCRCLEREGVDAVFAPADQAVYPRGRENITRVEVPVISELLEGAHRPGHFTGVATVVCKLFHLVQPDVAVFGEKDFQQLLLIRRMVEDLDLPVRVESGATVRESDGLALSSRNAYLTPQEREKAPALYRILGDLAGRLRETAPPDPAALEREGMKALEISGLRPDYVAVRRREDLLPPREGDRQLVVLGAAWLGRARLIDNLPVDLPPAG